MRWWCVPVGMRPLLLLSSLVFGHALSAQPGDPSIFPPSPRMEPSISHRPIRSGPPTPAFYYLTDTIEVLITGYVKLDGSCSGGTPLYGFQRKEGKEWTDYLPPCNVQLCCGMPSASWYQRPIALIPAHVAMPGRSRPWKPGEYRAVVLLAGDKELVGPAFTVVKAE